MARLSPFLLPQYLFSKAVIKLGAGRPVQDLQAIADLQHDRILYILSVLEASPSIRAEVREVAIANVAADPTNPIIEGQRQLVCILTAFEHILAPAEQVAFIRSFRGAATVQSQGPKFTALRNTYQPGHIPPISEP